MNVLLITDRKQISEPIIHYLSKNGIKNITSYNKLNLPSSSLEHLHCYKFRKKSVDVMVTGLGMANTAYFLGRMISLKHYDFIINFGLASTFSKKLRLGEVVKVYEDNFSDMGVESSDGFIHFSDVEQLDDSEKSAFKNNIYNKTIVESTLTDNLNAVVSVSTNAYYGSSKILRSYKEKFHPDIQTLDGAAVAYIANLEEIPFLQLRAIERKVGHWDKSEIKTDLAIKNLNELLSEFLNIF